MVIVSLTPNNLQFRRKGRKPQSKAFRGGESTFALEYGNSQRQVMDHPYSRTFKTTLSYNFTHPIYAATTGVFSDTFNLNGVTDYAQYVSIFDQFRVDWVEMRVVPSWRSLSPIDQDAGFYICAVNLNDTGTTSASKLQSCGNGVTTPINEIQVHRWRPRWVISNISGAGWLNLDGTGPTTNWYGLKTYITTSHSEDGTMTYYVRAGVTFRGNRA